MRTVMCIGGVALYGREPESRTPKLSGDVFLEQQDDILSQASTDLLVKLLRI
jgi:hypothetical protein